MFRLLRIIRNNHAYAHIAADRKDETMFKQGENMLRRVKKTEIQPDRLAKLDGLDYCLECWTAWMGNGGPRNLGMQTMGGLAGEGDGRGPDLYEAQHANDNRIALATDAMIDSLPRLHVWAIYSSCSIGTPWRFPNADLVLVAEDARAELVVKLKKNICTSILF